MIGIRDVARHAGVSTATVTRVLHGNTRVSPETRAKVIGAVRSLGYVPNAAARALTSGRSRLLGLLVPDIVNPFFAEVAQGLEDHAAESGYHALIGSSHLQPERERQFMAAFRDRTLAAVAMTPSGTNADAVRELAESGMPLVFVDRRPRGLRAPIVRTDNRAAAARAVRHLIALGHRRIAMLSGPHDFETASQRLAGFTAAMREAALPVEPSLIRQGHLGAQGGYVAMREVLDLPNPPTAVFCFNNLLTVGALQAVREQGMRMPDDLSLISFDDMSLFPFTDPPLTAIAQPAYEMGIAAAGILIDRLTGVEGDAKDVVFRAELKERGSCGPPPRAART